VEKQGSLDLAGSSVEEFADLNKALDVLTSRARQAYESQKEFTENAAHELQTPLAILQGKLELLMQTSPLNAEQAGLIDELADASGRMLRLNKSLILLSQIDNKQFPETEEVNLDEVVNHFVYEFSEQVAQKRLSLSVKMEQEVILRANRVLIEILIRNLLGNAIRHNTPGGSISIHGTVHDLTIRNSGRASSLDKEKVFTRFQKESTDSSSIGLGLEIARKVCDLYGYVLNYEYKGGEHCFEVVF
jgi:signal transduction histidine kinase